MPDRKEREPNKASIIVAIGASAAGLEALEKFFRNVPPSTGISYVVIQHLLPDQKSILDEILGRYTQMEVLQITNEMEIRTDTVYVIPPGKNIEVTDTHFRVKEMQRSGRLKMPIDHFLRSLKNNRKEKSIAVILSGTGSDGTLGIREIKEEFGMVMAQLPETAGYRGMPQSAIDTGLVDFILPPEDMPGQLLSYIERFADGEDKKGIFDIPDLDKVLKGIFSILKSTSRHDFTDYKRNTVFRRIERRMTVNSLKSLHDYLNLLKSSTGEAMLLFRELLIGVTGFFRDPDAYRFLENHILPSLVQKMSSTGILRVWVTACATGEEAYSVAMLVHRFIENSKINAQVQVFSTDIDDRALEAGRFGKYLENIAADIPEDLLKKYFVKVQNSYHVTKNIRDMIIFANQSLLKDPPYSRIDIISCRNFLIYLNPNIQQRIMKIFHYSLNPGGYLFLGNSENINSKPDLFKPVDPKWKVFQKLEAPTYIHEVWNYPELDLSPRHDKSKQQPASHIALKEFSEKTALDQFMNPMLVINKEGDILYSLGSCRDYFEFHVGEPNSNILNVAGEGLKVPLANGLRKINTERKVIRYEGIKVFSSKENELVNVVLMPVEKPVSLSNLFIVYIEPVRRLKKDANRIKKITAYSEDYIKEMELELSETRDYLQNVIEELQSTNEELKSSSEETQSANEELQSANEELETSKEELQSLNEELSTSNSELQRKIDEVSKVNNDINNLLTSIQIGTLFLNKDLIIQRFTPSIKCIIQLIESDIGRPISNFVTKLESSVDLIGLSETVIERLIPKEMEIKVHDQYYWMRILPYRTFEDSIEGVVITFTDVSEQKKMRKEIELVNERYLALFESLINGVIFFEIHKVPGKNSFNAYATLANKAFEKQTGLPGNELIGKSIHDIFSYADKTLITKLIDTAIHDKSFESEEYFTELDQYFKISSFSPGPMQLAVVLQNITSFKNEIKAKLLLSSIVMSTDDAIFTVDKEGRISSWNDGACKLYGYSSEEVLGKSTDQIILDEPIGSFDFRNRKPQKSIRSEAFHIHKNGHRIAVSVTQSPVMDMDHLIATSFVVKDNSTIKNREQDMIEAKENAEHLTRMKTSFLENLSHEIKTPLNSILGFTELLQHTPLNGDQKTKLEIVTSSTRQLIQLVSEINDLNRLKEGKIPLNESVFKNGDLLSDIIKQAEGLLMQGSRKETVELRLNVPRHLKDLIIRADKEKLHQILLNLTYNAIKFTHEGYIEVGCYITENKSITIYVKDTGIGIDPKDHKRIFEPFEQVHHQNEIISGTGLGLTIVKEFVQLMKGELSVESEPGKGSMFMIKLPFEDGYEENTPVQIPDKTEAGTDLRGNTILVVEDDTMIQQLLDIMISETGASVIKAYNGPEAIRKFRENKVDLVLLDKRLPGMDGFKVLEELKEIKPEVPVIGQSAHIMNSEIEEGIRMGMAEFITKPFEMKQIHKIFTKYLFKNQV